MPSNTLDSASSLMEEEFNQWLQWMKATPSPLILNLTTHVHDLVLQNRWVSEEHLKFIDTSLEQYISRIGCRVILLPWVGNRILLACGEHWSPRVREALIRWSV
jgi:hypothetical protein